MMTVFHGLVIAAVVIVLILAYVAFRLQRRVWQVEKEQAAHQEVLMQQCKEHEDYLNNSIKVLSQGIIDDQVTLTEGAIRISVLLSNLSLTESEQMAYRVFQQLSDATAHIPILDAWKRLSKKKKRQFEQERLGIEGKYHEFVIDAAKGLRHCVFPLKKQI